MIDYLQDIPEEKQKTVIEKCYKDVFDLYNAVLHVGSTYCNISFDKDENLKTPSEIQNINWDDFSNTMKTILDRYTKILETSAHKSNLALETYDNSSKKFSSLRKITEIEGRKEAGLSSKVLKHANGSMRDEVRMYGDIDTYQHFLHSFVQDNPDAFKIENGRMTENTEKGREFFNSMKLIMAHSHSKDNLVKIIRICGDLNSLTKENIPDDFFSPHSDIELEKIYLSYVKRMFEETILDSEFRRKEKYINDKLNKLSRKLERTMYSSKKQSKEIKETDIEQRYDDFFRKVPTTISQDEKSSKHIEFVRGVAKQFNALDETTYKKLNELTGIEHNLLFHIVDDVRELKQSEKHVFSSITGKEYI
ncbi:MAG: hypothetical protein PHU12_04425 [Candidatus Aenigmarchaeota archaeon]|nr:hypothetical protein [Candidatus Aenigmarchaeota archaeon]